MPTYPTTLPCPTWEYSEEISTYHNRTLMECGWARQRKRWPTTGVALSLTFQMKTAEFNTWAEWIDDNGYDWFTIDLDQYGGPQFTTDIRFIDPYQYNYEAFDIVRVNVLAERFDGDA